MQLGKAGGGEKLHAVPTFNVVAQGMHADEYLGYKMQPKKISISTMFYVQSQAGNDEGNRVSTHLWWFSDWRGDDRVKEDYEEDDPLMPNTMRKRQLADSESKITNKRFFRLSPMLGHMSTRYFKIRYRPRKPIEVTDAGAGYMTNIPRFYVWTDIDKDKMVARMDCRVYVSWYDI